MLTYTHTHMYTYTHTHMLTHTHVHIHTHTHVHIHTSHMLTHTHVHAHTHSWLECTCWLCANACSYVLEVVHMYVCKMALNTHTLPQTFALGLSGVVTASADISHVTAYVSWEYLRVGRQCGSTLYC